MVTALRAIEAYCDAHAMLPDGARVVVAVSGGVDSLALLALLHNLMMSRNLMLHVATLDHGIRGKAGAADAAFVREMAVARGLPVTIGRADVPRVVRDHHVSVEDAARRVRYAFLARVARTVGADRVAVGHHRDDQSETVLMNLIRGSGLDGLCGMLPVSPLVWSDEWWRYVELLSTETGGVEPMTPVESLDSSDMPLQLIRPLLNTSRAEIEQIAAAYDLSPRIDATNTDRTYRRNLIRHEIMSRIASINPQFSEALARLAEIVRVDADRLRVAGEAAYTQVVRAAHPDVITLDRAAWRGLHLADKRYVLRAVVEQLVGHRRNLAFGHVDHAVNLADHKPVGAQAQLVDGITLRIGYDALTILRAAGAERVSLNAAMQSDAPGLDEGVTVTFRAGEQVERSLGGWVFSARPLRETDNLAAIHADPLAAALAIPAGVELTLRSRRPGERFKPRGMGGRSQKLQDTLVNMRVPEHWRRLVPLLVVQQNGDQENGDQDVIAWFVAPSEQGLRGRVAEPFSVPGDHMLADQLIIVQWSRPTQG